MIRWLPYAEKKLLHQLALPATRALRSAQHGHCRWSGCWSRSEPGMEDLGSIKGYGEQTEGFEPGQELLQLLAGSGEPD